MAYESQSESLKYVQKFGPELEKAVRTYLGWPAGRVTYFEQGVAYDVQVDGAWPNTKAPQAALSVTYTNPDNPGHSNENKLQLKLGELILLKVQFPQIRSLLVLGGEHDSWLGYVVHAFEYFFDKVIFMWEDDAPSHLEQIRRNPQSIPLKHENLWTTLRAELEEVGAWQGQPIDSFLRERAWNLLKSAGREGLSPSDISNSILRKCFQASYERFVSTRGRSGKEWEHYSVEAWEKIWQTRNFFNPAEAAIQLTLDQSHFGYAGGLAVDVNVPSLLHHLAIDRIERTKLNEDFVLFSRSFEMPVFIQSKASGGGLGRHGKNIQNRTKEQLARGVLYRGVVKNGEIALRPRDFIWIGVLDGDWGVTKRSPAKYLNMLRRAGYQHLLPADALVDHDFEIALPSRNPLTEILTRLDCTTDQAEFERHWAEWRTSRNPRLAGLGEQSSEG